MKIIDAKISDLIPYAFNNRVHGDQQIDRIANSIKEFGFNQPIVIDESNIILVGHGRFAAAQKLGLEVVPVLKLDNLTEAQKKAYRILDNKLAADSEWNFESLELEFTQLEELNFKLEPWGLDQLANKIGIETSSVPEEEWEGMPSYESEDETAFKTIKVHFISAEHVQQFSELLQQQITDSTRSLWFPEAMKKSWKNIRVVDES